MLEIRPVELATANAFVEAYHRHHKRAQGHRFSVGVYDDGRLCGVAIVGRPVARMGGNPLTTLEVTRLCTDGTAHACSKLYAAAARIGREMGFERIQTYVLDTESGTSVRAAGWEYEGAFGGGQWKHTDGRPRREDQPTCAKGRWARSLTRHKYEARPFEVKEQPALEGLL